MGLLPPLPGWDGLHPLVIHFPIALLLVAPLLVVLALVSRTHGRSFLLAALVVMLLGVVASWVAVGTGEAAGELAERAGAVESALERHEDLGETTRNLFTALTAAFALVLFGPGLLKRQLARPLNTLLLVVFLALYAGGTLVLVRTAHQGGLLVHEYGVHALVAGGTAAAPTAEPGDQD